MSTQLQARHETDWRREMEQGVRNHIATAQGQAYGVAFGLEWAIVTPIGTMVGVYAPHWSKQRFLEVLQEENLAWVDASAMHETASIARNAPALTPDAESVVKALTWWEAHGHCTGNWPRRVLTDRDDLVLVHGRALASAIARTDYEGLGRALEAFVDEFTGADQSACIVRKNEVRVWWKHRGIRDVHTITIKTKEGRL